jgi:hypothetical protein
VGVNLPWPLLLAQFENRNFMQPMRIGGGVDFGFLLCSHCVTMRFPNSFPSSSHVLKTFPTAPQFYSIPFGHSSTSMDIYKLERETYHKTLAASTQIILFLEILNFFKKINSQRKFVKEIEKYFEFFKKYYSFQNRTF